MEHVHTKYGVEVTAKRRLFLVTSVTDIRTKNSIVCTAARHRTACQPYLEKIPSNCCCRLALRINKDGTTKNEEKKKRKNEKTEVEHKKSIESKEKLERSSK